MDKNNNQLIRLERLRKFARLLDSQYQLPGGIKIGWDSILTWVPGVGDLVTNFLSLYIIYQGILMGVPPSVVLRMGLNLLIDNLIDVIPILGNVFDIFWKANNKNVVLLEDYFRNPERTQNISRIVTGVSLFLLLMIMAGAIALVLTAVMWSLHFLSKNF